MSVQPVRTVERFDLLYVNLGPDGASTVIRDQATGERLEVPGGPVEIIHTEHRGNLDIDRSGDEVSPGLVRYYRFHAPEKVTRITAVSCDGRHTSLPVMSGLMAVPSLVVG